MVQQVIGVDLGGTDIKFGRYDHQGHCLFTHKIPTPQPPEPNRVIAAIADSIQQIDTTKEAIAVGIGTPGPADAEGRMAKLAINLGGWVNVPLADRLEGWLGAGKPYRNWILLTLGTGVGGAIFLNGEIFVGHKGTAGELGLVTVDLNGHPCNSGNNGSLEQHASAQAIRRRTGLEPGELAEKAHAGNQEAIAFWQQYGRELAAGLASSIYVLAPEAVIIGGGICAAAGLFFPSMKTEVERRVKPTSREGLQFAIAKLGNQAGNAGAARLAWQKYGVTASR
jgi:glucokinase